MLRRGIASLDSGHYFASFGLCINICHKMLPQDISGKLFSTGVYFVVAFAAKNYKVLGGIIPTFSMFFYMMKLENSWVFTTPFFPVPSTKATCVIVSFVYLFLNFEWYLAVVRFGNSIFTLKYIFTHSQIGSACKLSCNRITLLCSQLTYSTTKFSFPIFKICLVTLCIL